MLLKYSARANVLLLKQIIYSLKYSRCKIFATCPHDTRELTTHKWFINWCKLCSTTFSINLKRNLLWAIFIFSLFIHKSCCFKSISMWPQNSVFMWQRVFVCVSMLGLHVWVRTHMQYLLRDACWSHAKCEISEMEREDEFIHGCNWISCEWVDSSIWRLLYSISWCGGR